MKIICIGRNYSEHAKEMKAEIPKEPVVFLKPDTALLKEKDFFYPNFSQNIHFETELVVKISKAGTHIKPEFAHKYYQEIGLGIDFTARDIQKECKAKSLPWEKAKAFDQSAYISADFIDKSTFEDVQNIPFSLKKNNELVQSGNSQNMLFTIDEIIAHVSKYFTLKTGDLIYTGTPSGVGPVSMGEELEGFIGEKSMFKFYIR